MRIFLLLFVTVGIYSDQVHAQVEFEHQIASSSLEQIDSFRIPKFTIQQYESITNFAIDLFNDTTQSINKLKGKLLLSKLADSLTIQINKGKFNVHNEQVSILCNKYKRFKLYICQVKTDDFLKTALHACDDDYPYIFNRFKGKSYFIPVVISAVMVLLFFVMNSLKILKWKFRRTFNVLLVMILCLAIIGFITFRLTCRKCVTEKSFYGVPM